MSTSTNNVPFDDVYAASDAILAHTWLHNGGTFNSYTGEPVGEIDGYVVNAGVCDTLRISVDSAWVRERVARFIQAIPIIGEHKPYVGTWIDDNILYVDVVKVYTNKFAAIAQGYTLGEKAIFDLSTQTTIYL